MNTLKRFITPYESSGGKSNICYMFGKSDLKTVQEKETDSKWKGGAWLIPDNIYGKFLELYFEAVKSNNLKFTEKKVDHNETYHMLADIDISEEHITTYFLDKLPQGFLNSIIQLYDEVMVKLLDIEHEYIKPVISCRLNKPQKFHLNWPNITINNRIGNMIRNELIKLCRTKYLDITGNEIGNNWGKWIDAAVYTCTGLRLLGTVKTGEHFNNRYYVIKGYDDDNKPINHIETLTLEDIKLTSIRSINRPLVKLTKLGESLISVKIPITITKRNKFKEDAKLLTNEESKAIQAFYKRSFTMTNYPHYPKLVSDFRWDEPILKLDNGYVMKHPEKISCIFKGTEHNRPEACHYHILTASGMQFRCYNEECKGLAYPTIPIPLDAETKAILYINTNNTNNNITVNQTIVPASVDSSVEYDFITDIDNIFIFNDITKDTILLNSLNGGHSDPARLLHQIANNAFYFVKGGSLEKGWWYWNKIRWVKGGDSKLSDILYIDITTKVAQVKCQYKLCDKDKIKDVEDKICQIDKFCKSLKTVDYKNKILKEAEWVFDNYQNDNKIYLDLLLNSKPNLIGFENGVYDLETNQFRESEPSDYITFSTGYDYCKELKEDAVSGLDKFLKDIMPNDDDRHYLVKLLSTGLIGANPDELFHIFTGAGRNGKSKLNELFQMTLGRYCKTFTSTFLTSNMSAGEAASPQLMELKDIRMAIGSEPQQGFKLNAATIKLLSGNDEIVGRKLYQGQTSYKPCFKMILLCNDIPEIDGDKAVWSRCRVLAFPTLFVDDPKATNERQLDVDLNKNFTRWKQPFMHLLIKYYNIYLTERLKMTPNMKIRTNEYKMETDIYLNWLTERTEPSNTNIQTTVLHEDFKAWIKANHVNKSIPTHLQFVKGIKVHKEVEEAIYIASINLSRKGIANLQLKTGTPQFGKVT